MSDLESDRLKELEKILLDDDHASDGQLHGDALEEQRSPTKRKRVRGRTSRNRRKRKHRSRGSNSSSYSYESSVETSKDSESDSNPFLERKLRERDDESRKKYEPPSPLQNSQEGIPKKIEFVSSLREAPEIVGLEKRKETTIASEDSRQSPRALRFLRSRHVRRERGEDVVYERLPLVASPLATVPVLDDGLRALNYRLPLDEQSMVVDSECVMNALNLLAISRNEAAEQRADRVQQIPM